MINTLKSIKEQLQSQGCAVTLGNPKPDRGGGWRTGRNNLGALLVIFHQPRILTIVTEHRAIGAQNRYALLRLNHRQRSLLKDQGVIDLFEELDLMG